MYSLIIGRINTQNFGYIICIVTFNRLHIINTIINKSTTNFLMIMINGNCITRSKSPLYFNNTSGQNASTLMITLGAVGIISVIGNAFPREFSRMVRLALQGDYSNALTIHHKFAELFKLLFVDGNPAGVKAMLNAMGMIENKLRLPLVPTRITTFEAMRKILDELNIKC